jgi:phosphatidylglycerol lysyltransferase
MLSTILISILVFLSGILNIWSSLNMPVQSRIIFLENIYPISIAHFSRTISLILGFFLLYLARGIYLRKERSWYLSIFASLLSIIFHLIKGFDFEEALILSSVLIILLLTKKYFLVKSSRSTLGKRLRISIMILSFLFIYSIFGFYLLQGQFRTEVNLRNITNDYIFSITGEGVDTLIPRTRHAKWFEESITTVGIFSLLLVILTIFGPFDDLTKPTETEKERAKYLTKKYYSGELSTFNFTPDKSLFFDKSKMSFLSYKIFGGVAVVLGNPTGYSKYFSDCITEFTEFCKGLGIIPCFYSVSNKFDLIYLNNKYKSIKFGQEAIIDTKTFDLSNPKLKDIRYSYNKIKKSDIIFKWSEISGLNLRDLNRIDDLYKKWVNSKKLSNLKFSLNYYPLSPEIDGDILMLYDTSGSLQAFFSFYPYANNKERSLDLMIRNISSPSGSTEASMAEAIEHYKTLYVDKINLGMAPFSVYINDSTKPNRFIKIFIKNLNKFYKVTSLYKFKEQFNPYWISKYIYYKNDFDLPKIAVALLSVHLR